jgi:hypothetical protein
MGVHYEWANEEHTIAHMSIKYPWTWDEYIDVTTDLMTTIRGMNHLCATITDVSQYGELPNHGNPLYALLNMEKIIPDNLSVIVLVGATYTATVFTNILLNLRPRMRRMIILAATMSEAHEKILARKP